jgi:hypothetical protein
MIEIISSPNHYNNNNLLPKDSHVIEKNSGFFSMHLTVHNHLIILNFNWKHSQSIRLN